MEIREEIESDATIIWCGKWAIVPGAPTIIGLDRCKKMCTDLTEPETKVGIVVTKNFATPLEDNGDYMVIEDDIYQILQNGDSTLIINSSFDMADELILEKVDVSPQDRQTVKKLITYYLNEWSNKCKK